jgi:hypothetical protein
MSFFRSPQPPSEGELKCTNNIYLKFTGCNMPEAFPEKVVGAVSHCTGPRGHTGEHVGGIVEGQYYVIWAPYPNADGVTSWSIQDRKGNS